MKNAGYTIIQSEIYDAVNMYGVALGFNGMEYVTWEFTVLESNEISYYWGHYITDTWKAHLDYHKRIVDKYEWMVERSKANETK